MTDAAKTVAACPRTVRTDGRVDGDGSCHSCGLGDSCPLFDPWLSVDAGFTGEVGPKDL